MLRRLLFRLGLLRLPRAHETVLLLLHTLDAGEGVSWERLREAARAEGISEHELELIVYGGLREDVERLSRSR